MQLPLTVHIQNEHFGVWRSDVRVACRTHESGVQVLSSHIVQRQPINCDSIGTVLKGVVHHLVAQVPGHIGSGSPCRENRLVFIVRGNNYPTHHPQPHRLK